MTGDRRNGTRSRPTPLPFAVSDLPPPPAAPERALEGASGAPVVARVEELLVRGPRDVLRDALPNDGAARLHERLREMDAPTVLAVEEAVGHLRGPLDLVLGLLGVSAEAPAIARASIRTVVRCTACVVDNARAGSSIGLPLDRMRMTYRATDLAEHVRAQCGAFGALAREREIELALDAPPALPVEVDAAKVELALVKLVFNAVKYTGIGSTIRCRLEVDDQDMAAFSVVDGGPGVSWASRETLFDRARLNDRTVFPIVAGIRFSLATARDLVVLHGGELDVHNDPRGGAVFTARIPVRAPAGLRVRPAPASARDDRSLAAHIADVAARELRIEANVGSRTVVRGGRPLVLIVEDSRPLQRVLIDCLEPEHVTASALDGVEGLEKAIALHPDLIITDLGMPRMPGEQLVERVRATPDLAQIPILVVSGTEDADEKVRLLEAGVEDVLQKPFLMQEIRARVRKLVAAKRTRDVLCAAVGRKETDLVVLAADLARSQDDLRRALADVQAAREAAESASQVKSNFLRMMSHEIKTPITAMQLHLRMLERDPAAAASTPIGEGLARVWRSSQRLLHLVDTVLEWARIESGRSEIVIEEVDLAAMLRDVLGELEGFAAQKQLGLRLDVGPAAKVHPSSDRRVLRLLLLNLVTRAIQLTDRGDVEVSVVHGDDTTRVRVHDLGTPLQPEMREELFDPLASAQDLRWRGGSGSGLGLYVVRDIARAIDGDVVLDRPEGAGNTLTLVLRRLDPDRVTGRVYVGGAGGRLATA
jgi:signal transduction histidine kinase